MHDAQEFEAAGLPVAWVDTPGRVPRVRRRKGVFRVDYSALRRRATGGKAAPAGTAELPAPTARALLQRSFEKFGLNRALRLAGAAPGDRISAGDFGPEPLFEFELWEYPEPLFHASCDGIRDYPCIETPRIARLDRAGIAELAHQLAPSVEAALLGRSTS